MVRVKKINKVVNIVDDMIEIRWHGRGGQGAKTAAMLLAEAALGSGKFVQAFPEYGPERTGAPVQSFNRISKKQITTHASVTSPDYVVVLDSTLIGKVNILQGLPKNGTLLINSPDSPSDIRKKLNIKDFKIFTVDASKISQESIGRNIPNTPMLGAIVKISNLVDYESFLKDTKAKLEKKFRTKQELVAGNMKAIERATHEVVSE